MSKSVLKYLIYLFVLTSQSSVRLYDGITSTRLNVQVVSSYIVLHQQI